MDNTHARRASAGHGRAARCTARRDRQAAALRRALRGEGQYRRRRSADDRRLPRLLLPAAAVGRGRAPPGRGRRHRRRQDQPRPVRHRPGRRALALRRAEKSVRSGVRAGRFQLGLGRRRRRRPGELRARHRHRRLRPRAGRLQQHPRPETHARPFEHRWRRAGLQVARLRVGVRALVRRRRCRAEGRGRAAGDDGDRQGLPLRRLAARRRRVLRRRRLRGPLCAGGRPIEGAGRHRRRDRLRAVPRCRGASLRRALGRRAHRRGRRLHRGGRRPGRHLAGHSRHRHGRPRVQRGRRLRRPVRAGRAQGFRAGADGRPRFHRPADDADDLPRRRSRARAGALQLASRPLHQLRELLRALRPGAARRVPARRHAVRRHADRGGASRSRPARLRRALAARGAAAARQDHEPAARHGPRSRAGGGSRLDRRRRCAHERPAAQRPAHRAGRAAGTSGQDRLGLPLLRPARRSATPARHGARRPRRRRHRARSLEPAGGRGRQLPAQDPRAAGPGHGHLGRRLGRAGLLVRRPRHCGCRGHHLTGRLAGLFKDPARSDRVRSFEEERPMAERSQSSPARAAASAALRRSPC